MLVLKRLLYSISQTVEAGALDPVCSHPAPPLTFGSPRKFAKLLHMFTPVDLSDNLFAVRCSFRRLHLDHVISCLSVPQAQTDDGEPCNTMEQLEAAEEAAATEAYEEAIEAGATEVEAEEAGNEAAMEVEADVEVEAAAEVAFEETYTEALVEGMTEEEVGVGHLQQTGTPFIGSLDFRCL